MNEKNKRTRNKNRYEKKARSKTRQNREKPNFKLFVILKSPEVLKGLIFDNNWLYRSMTLVKQLCHSSPRNKHEIKTGTKKQIGEKLNATEQRKTKFYFILCHRGLWLYIWRLSIYFGNNQIFNRRKKVRKTLSCLVVFFQYCWDH